MSIFISKPRKVSIFKMSLVCGTHKLGFHQFLDSLIITAAFLAGGLCGTNI